MYEVKYEDLRGNIINENEALENGNYYKSYYENNIIVKTEIVKNKEILNVHYFYIEKEDLSKNVQQHINNYKNVSACFHNKLEKVNEDCFRERMNLYNEGKMDKIEDNYIDAEGNELKNITYKIEGEKLIPVFEIEYSFDEYGDVIEKYKKY